MVAVLSDLAREAPSQPSSSLPTTSTPSSSAAPPFLPPTTPTPGIASSALPRMDPTHPGEEATVATQRCPSYKCKKCAIHARVNVYVGRAYPSLQGKHVWYYPHPSELGLESRFGWSCGSSAIEIWTNCSAPEIITGPLPTCPTKYFMKADVIHYSPPRVINTLSAEALLSGFWSPECDPCSIYILYNIVYIAMHCTI